MKHLLLYPKELRIAEVTTVGQLYQIAGPDLKNVSAIAGHLRLRSCRIVQKAIEIWSSALTGEEKGPLDQFLKGSIHFNCKDLFPNLRICPIMGECNGMLLDCDDLIIVGSEIAPGTCLYTNCVKAFSKTFLNNKSDTPWRDVLKLRIEEKTEWRALYKSPLAKKTGDLQWRILHGAIALNVFISLFKSDSTDCCPFCLQRETLFRAFMYCERLKPIFDML